MSTVLPSSARMADDDLALAKTGLVAALTLTLMTGIAIGIVSAYPLLISFMPSMRVLRPLHTLGTLVALLCGVIALRTVAIDRARGRRSLLASRLSIPVIAFLITAGIMIVLGQGSGLEYIGWPLWLTWLPVAVLVLMAWDTIRNLKTLCTLSPEGAWLLMMGLCLAPLGMIERVLGADVHGITRSLTIEWHALDTIFAGFNTALYGLAILLVSEPGRGRPLRHRWLYLLAVFALLSTFGHHHYMSGQLTALKWIAFTASMLGLVSFVRHVGSTRRGWRQRMGDSASSLFYSATLWTAFAVGSGVLLAVPQINLILHGTHAVVGHAMGAVIGVDVMIILAGLMGRSSDPVPIASVHRGVVLCNIALSLIVLDLFVAGTVKGILRMSEDHHQYLPVVRNILIPLPLFGIALTIGLSMLGHRVLRGSVNPLMRSDGAKHHARHTRRTHFSTRPIPNEPHRNKTAQ